MENAELGAEILQQVLRCSLYEQAIYDKIEELSDQEQAAGFRVVGGGSDYDESWEVTDEKTGDVIASGVGSESREEASADAWINWVHIDGISTTSMELVEESYFYSSSYSLLPESLCDALLEWVRNFPEDIAELYA